MDLIIFLYFVGYGIGLGCAAENEDFVRYGNFVVLVGCLLVWPMKIGAAIARNHSGGD